ncbi:hypothetical protein [Pseudonocardia acaciae]|uniref:hypothetical protein n=1 Tax=Pseudonocardia acaciae TaxID=551276 RepID=UPI00048ECED2|nr:hypothetical protein [Pseudonocardia acaciae]
MDLFVEPSPHVFVYLGFEVGGRRAVDEKASELKDVAATVRGEPSVVDVHLFRATFTPPIPGGPRFDLAMLVRTSAPETTSHPDLERLGATMTMSAHNPCRIGDTDAGRPGATYLFNHFHAPDVETAVTVWKGLAGWFTANTGIDNSTPLAALGDSAYPLVNFARLPSGPRRFLLRQFTRPSFRTRVLAPLRAHRMAAMPIFYRPL